MKKMKKSSEPRDRLSELPDSLIFNIFEFLPMNDVVGTQILSHRWKNLWTITPYLYFDNDKASNVDKFRNFVNRCLLSWRGERIQKFKVSSYYFDKSLFSDMNLWVRFAVDNGVQELDTSVHAVRFDPYEDDYCVPKCLYSRPALQKLSFFGSIMEIDGNVMQWNQLKSLNIKCFWITQHAIDLLLSKCPVLEVFNLSFMDNNLSLSFQSSSLKELDICKRRKLEGSPDDISMDTELRIWTPNLEILKIYGVAYHKFLLLNVSSLTHATLWFRKNDYLYSTLSQIFPTIQHVEGLTLSNSCTKALGSLTSNGLLLPLPSVTFLNLNGSFEEHERIVGLLEIFPKLKKLVVREESKHIDSRRKKKKFKPNPSKSFLAELRTVEVTWTMRDFMIFPLIKILLKYACRLEKMVFRVERTAPRSRSSDYLLLASQTDLLSMPRSSPTAKLIFCGY